MTQLGAYGAPDRDPRNRTVSVAFLAELDRPAELEGGSDAAETAWRSLVDALREADAGELAFDHAVVLRDGVSRSRWASWISSPHADPG